MFKEKLGNITLKEKEEILLLLEKKTALQELINTLDSQTYSDKEKENLHIRILHDQEKNQSACEKWITEIFQKYHWNICNSEQCSIDFNTSEIFKVHKNQYIV